MHCSHSYAKCLYIVPGHATTVLQNNLVAVFLYAYIWAQDKLILVLPRLMHFSGIVIAGLCFDYTGVKIVCLLDRDVFAPYKKKVILCVDLHLYYHEQ